MNSFSVELPPLEFVPSCARGQQPNPQAWWRCRWCGLREDAPMVVAVERLRALTHEALCAQRTDGEPVDPAIFDVYLGEWRRCLG